MITYTPPPPPSSAYQRFVDIALDHRDWDIGYRADETGTGRFEALHGSGLAISTPDLGAFALLLRLSDERLLDLEDPPARVRPYLVAWEREQAEREAEETAALMVIARRHGEASDVVNEVDRRWARERAFA
ncbi:hypothetical protein J0910_29860 [Nocardiopsis sp. CNT-189]|uniref:hypothetical protein n=1 Tax=Nocardiopsis oceanisediminis TaxID=2816862 RepID=UPI003B2AA431